jgi:hypothetical protein
MLKIGDHLGDGGLRHAEFLSGLAHTSHPRNSRKHMKIAQAQAPADLAFPIDPRRHIQFLMGE